MKPYEEEINAYFNKLHAQYGLDIRSLGWSSASQKKRFDVFAGLADLTGKTILDVGCGFGDLAAHLNDRYPYASYMGFDINPAILEHARKSDRTSYKLHNILEEQPEKKYDAVFSLGALNTRFTDNIGIMKKLIEACYEACYEIAAISMTSAFVDAEYATEDMFYYDPGEMLNYGRTLCKRVSLLHDYLPHDFTLILKKRPAL